MYLQEDLTKLLVALAIGGVIGAERELHNKAAGFRTITLITIGATLFTMLSMNFQGGSDRVASTIVSGVGFLGAGSIMFLEGKVKGLTTASSVWAAAALGMAVGMGRYDLAVTFGLATLIILWQFSGFDRWLGKRSRETVRYEITYERPEKFRELERQFENCGLRIRERKQLKLEGFIVAQWDLEGKIGDHECAVSALLSDKEITEVDY